MKKTLVAISVFVSLLLGVSTHAEAACNVTINVPNALMVSNTIAWSTTCPDGSYFNLTGIQSAIDTVRTKGGGNVILSGAGSVLVTDPLVVTGSNVTVMGDTARTPYGMDLVGENDPGYNYRGFGHPIFSVSSATSATIYNFRFLGNSYGRRLTAAITVEASQGATITYNSIEGVRQKAVTISNSNWTAVNWVSITAKKRDAGEPQGGAGIWLSGSGYSVIEHNLIRADDYYFGGNPDPLNNPAFDEIASYGGTNNAFQHNTLYYGNTAGIYLAKNGSTRESGALIWDNDVHHFNQHGLDIDGATSSRITSNTVHEVKQAPLAMANVTYSEIDYNTLYLGSTDQSNPATMYLLWGSSNNNIHDNVVKGNYNGTPSTNYGIYLKGASDGYPDCTGNTFATNSVWTGSIGWFGGVTANNTFTGNILY